ncbi:ribonucleases P/MRP protein subunit POP1 [Histomonas meleagridis]|uniref:ribonucleases P/MRP protein subunit POP1 n=1 Tax=Histomonas meleagridis TaxID=135588 RepID=UPI003559F6F0|nr:ribonucleases P/MRP protein subunit POP1 [Histomonas meleagridis]KAH0801279.1 ribonucleases P/MRP protein subunit POP1 [Histomonas meleagridis]
MALATVVKAVDIAKERDPAINKMIEMMENQKPSNKRVFQRLPKHLRRRAMSYDIRKVPRAMRPSVQGQVESALEAKLRNKPKGRDHQKYRYHGTNQAVHRNEKHRWLETHLWHAKRFHMVDLWDWKIPLAPTMKQTRNFIRMTAESCTIRDISYTTIISLKGTHENLINVLTKFMKPNSRIEPSLHIMFGAEFYQPNGYPIGPVQLFWISDSHLWIISHPTLKSELGSSLHDGSYELEIIDGKINIFEVCGPLSTKVIRQSLQPSGETPEAIQQILYGIPHPSAVPPGFSISYTASDPRTFPDHLEDKTVPLFDFQNIPSNICESRLFSDRLFDCPDENEFNKERAKLLFPMAEGPSGSIPILLMQRYSTSPTGFGASWLVFSPFGCGSIIFKKFVKQGARVFGLEGSRKIDLEAGRFNFPNDRPDTNVGLQLMTKEMLEMTAANDSKPKGKRIALNFYQFPDQFRISCESGENSYLKVSIVMAKRGTPSRFSNIYLPDISDYQFVDKVAEIKGERKPIGMVLNGNSSLLAGEGRGIGIIETDAFLILLPKIEAEANFQFNHRPKQSLLALVKEQGSQFYHLAWISPHSSNFY